MPKNKPIHKVFKIPKSILLTGKVLQFFSTDLAASFVLKLFRTPYKFPRPGREKKMYEQSEKEMLFIPELNKRIQVYKCGSGKKKVLLVHGWAGRGTQLSKMTQELVENDFQVISFDATAHGESDGKTSAMPEFITSILTIEKKYTPFDFAIGHSLGGMALLQAVKSGFQVKKIVVIGVADSILDICKQFVERLGLQERVAYSLKNKMDKILQTDSEILSASVAAKEIKIPSLVIHDTQDTDVPLVWAENVFKHLAKGEMLVTEGLGHRRIISDDKVIRRILDYFNT